MGRGLSKRQHLIVLVLKEKTRDKWMTLEDVTVEVGLNYIVNGASVLRSLRELEVRGLVSGKNSKPTRWKLKEYVAKEAG